ncbi:hypothetical protein EHQ75_18285 [Leptospira levettii]|uniref:hypothetical protein n=1 Tax=Leptospira levettii TaxID=2023178 RepID=UPI00108373B9|nr:hypothetical protein [Leptospira levettii]TGM34756.1 hypothetical protein EHQ75_18285 [Leptospira levettii]
MNSNHYYYLAKPSLQKTSDQPVGIVCFNDLVNGNLEKVYRMHMENKYKALGIKNISIRANDKLSLFVQCYDVFGEVVIDEK